jgi:hypothetical protein
MSKTKHLMTRLIRIVLAGLTAISLTGAGAGLTAVTTIGAAAVLVGCTGGAPAGLPAPDVVCPTAPPEPVLNAEQRARQEQVNVYLAQIYDEARWKILLTTKTCSGDVWDWLDPATVPGSEIEPPPPPEHSGPDDVEPALTELEAHPELTLPDAVAMLRPSFMPYVMGDVPATSVRDFLAQEVHGRTDGAKRLYAGIGAVVDNLGASSAISVYQIKVARQGMSLMEMAISCGESEDPNREMIGVAVGADRLHEDPWDDMKPVPMRLRVEYFTAGYETTGDGKGGWLPKYPYQGYVPLPGANPQPGAILLPVSMPGGPVREVRLQIRYRNGAWWLAYNGKWIGYFPVSLFDGEMTSHACEVAYYGEVYDHDPSDWALTDMGSSQFAAAGWGQAAYFREPSYFDTAGVKQWPDVHTQRGPYDPACYTTSGLQSGGPNYERVLYCGGPGGDSPGCN